MEMIPLVLCIIQARLDSSRLPRKMLLPLNGETLIARAWRIACETFGADHCVVAIPGRDTKSDLGAELQRIGARVFSANCADHDVLSRFHACAHTFRWQPDSIIVRYTPDDPFKSPDLMQRVVNGERLPVELGAEAFYLYELDDAHENSRQEREHLTTALFQYPPPPAPDGVWTIDTEADYIDACVRVERESVTATHPTTTKRRKHGTTEAEARER